MVATAFSLGQFSVRDLNDFIEDAIADLGQSFSAIGDSAGIEINQIWN
jgi:hypothetical protein